MLVIIFLVIFGKTLLLLLYDKTFYLNSYTLLILLSFITTLQGVSGVLGFFITARGYQNFKLKCQIEFVIISIITILSIFRLGVYWLVLAFVIVQAYAIPRYGIFVYNEIERLRKGEIYSD